MATETEPSPGRTLPSPGDGGQRGGGRLRGHLIGTYGLLALTALLFLIFTVTMPDSFPTSDNLTSLLSTNAIPAMLALGAMIPIVTGKFDLSIGYGLGLWHVLTMQLIVVGGWPWQLACLVTIAGGTVVGVLNGLLVELAKIDSFIATLGTGSVLYALTLWITNGARVVPGPEGLPAWFTDLYTSTFLGLPVPAFYVLVLAFILWLVLERLPLGRYLYVIGSNARAADLVGIPTRRYSIYAFAGSGFVVGVSGVLLAAQQQIGNPSGGQDYLLPAFVGALLGSTAIKPGRANALGTIVAVTVLAVGLSGITLAGADFWVTPLFNGGTLLIAVGLAGLSARRRLRAGAVATRRSLTGGAPGAQSDGTPGTQSGDMAVPAQTTRPATGPTAAETSPTEPPQDVEHHRVP
jgi:ribose transport system permease protein